MAEKKRVIVLGAGPAGLGAAYQLMRGGYAVTIIDRAHHLGGASASFKIKDYIVDYGPHAFHIKDGKIDNLVKELIGNDYVMVKRKSRLMLDGKDLSYPLNTKEALFKINPFLSLKIMRDYLWIKIKRLLENKDDQIKTFEEWGLDAFGHTLYRLAFGNYSERMWGVSGKKLSARLAQQKLLKLNLRKLILKMLGLGDPTFEGGVVTYYDMYPRFGIGTIFDKMTESILKDNSNMLYLNSEIIKIDADNLEAKAIHLRQSQDIKTLTFDYLVSSIPLKYLTEYLFSPQEMMPRQIANKLKYRDLRIIYLVLDKDYYSDMHWMYLLDTHFRFNRFSEQKNLNKESSPLGKTVVSMDIACNYNDEIWNMRDDELFELALNDLNRLGIKRNYIIEYFTLKLRDIYPVYDIDFEKNLKELINILATYHNVYSTGRQGLFLNNDIHDSMEMGMLAGEFVLNQKESRQWYAHMDKYIKERLEGNIK